MDQKIKTYFVPKSQQARRDLNKRLKKEQEPSLKNKAKKALGSILSVAKKASAITNKKIDALIEDNKKINRVEGDLFGEMDKGLKSMGSSARGSWVHSSKSNKTTEPVKKKKTKKVK